MNVLRRVRVCGWIGLWITIISPSYAVDFDKEILPILEGKCYRCHGDEEVKGDLRLDSPEAILAGGEYGDVLIPGDPNESSLYVLTTYPKDDADYMPQKGKGLTPSEQKLLKQWITDGASFGESFVNVPAPKVKSKFEEADPADQRRYTIMGEAVEIVARLREEGLQVDTVNHDASRFEINYTYAERSGGAFAFDALAELGDTLVKLILARTDVTDVDLAGIVVYSNIEYLDLGRTGIGDDALEYISKLENLKILNLRDTNVTDASIQKLAKLKSLERVYLWGSQVTASGAKRLEKALGDGIVILGGELVGPRRRPGQQT